MSIYRWAKLDDQSGPDRSIELTCRGELPNRYVVDRVPKYSGVLLGPFKPDVFNAAVTVRKNRKDVSRVSA